MFKLVLEKPEEPEIKLPTSAGSSRKEESCRKTSISALLTMTKPLTVWITINHGLSLLYMKELIESLQKWKAAGRELCLVIHRGENVRKGREVVTFRV